MTRTRWRHRALRTALFSMLVGAPLWYVSVLPGHPVLAGVVMVLLSALSGLLLWLLSDHAAHLQPAGWHVPRRGDDAGEPLALDYRLVRLRRDLRDTLQRSDRGDPVHPLICDLVVEQVQQRWGVDARTDPQGAQVHVPAPLWHYLTHPPPERGRRSARELEQMLDLLEAI